MIDTHSHLFDEAFNMDLKECIDRCYRENVNKIVLVGFSKETNMLAQKLSKEYDIFYPTAGIHPSEADSDYLEQLAYLEDFINNNKVYAIGECGLDYYWTKDNMEYQKALFKGQIEMSIKYDLPIIIHMRDASNDTYELLKEYKGKIKGVMHCFSYDTETVKYYLDKGLYIGVGGTLTYKNNNILREAIKNVPLNRILLETDAPYLTPEPYRRDINNSIYIQYVISKLAEIKELSEGEVIKQTNKNAYELFKFGEK